MKQLSMLLYTDRMGRNRLAVRLPNGRSLRLSGPAVDLLIEDIRTDAEDLVEMAAMYNYESELVTDVEELVDALSNEKGSVNDGATQRARRSTSRSTNAT